MAKAIATIAGQYPHNSYAIVGGIVSEITSTDLVKMENYIDEVIKFYQDTLIDANIEDFLVCESVEKVLGATGDLPLILNTLKYGRNTMTYVEHGFLLVLFFNEVLAIRIGEL